MEGIVIDGMVFAKTDIQPEAANVPEVPADVLIGAPADQPEDTKPTKKGK